MYYGIRTEIQGGIMPCMHDRRGNDHKKFGNYCFTQFDPKSF